MKLLHLWTISQKLFLVSWFALLTGSSCTTEMNTWMFMHVCVPPCYLSHYSNWKNSRDHLVVAVFRVCQQQILLWWWVFPFTQGQTCLA